MGEKTLENLMAAFAGESQANRKYLAYAKQAEKEGKMNAAKLFRAAAEAETIHAHKEFELAGKLGTTSENLKDAFGGEMYENETMYPDFLKDAEAEGETKVAKLFKQIGEVEGIHAGLYQACLDNLENDQEEMNFYVCPVCGNITVGQPDKCDVCDAVGSKFQEVK